MKVNKWTAALASAGVLSGVAAVHAEESPVMTALSATTISGYVDVGAHWNLDKQSRTISDGEGGTMNAPYATLPILNKGASRKDDGFNLNVVNITIEKPLDEGQWAAGYKAELLFGPDATGYNVSNGAHTSSGGDFGIKQAYVDLRAPVGNGLDFKVGVFDTVIGYETFNNGSNPNYTRSWGWFVEPTQHTGVLANYRFNDTISASAGVANTLTPGINNRAHGAVPGAKSESDKTWMGSIAITAPESAGFLEGSTLYAGAVYGFSSGAAGGVNDNQANYYAGATAATPIKGLGLGLAYDYVHQNGGGNTSGDTYQNVFGLYASFAVTEKFSVHARGEYAHGEVISLSSNGTAADIYSGVLTLQYDLWANVITRAEVRYDTVENGKAWFGTSHDDQWLIAFNAIYQF
jgi:hypothetical protein